MKNTSIKLKGGKRKTIKKGGVRPREPCTPANVERKLVEVNAIISRSEDYKTLKEQKDALNRIEDLISPNDFGAFFVLMNAEYATNNIFRDMVIDRYTPGRPTPNILGGKSLKKKRTTKKKYRNTRRKSRK